MHNQSADTHTITELVVAGNDEQLVTLIFEVLDADVGNATRVQRQIAVAQRYFDLAASREVDEYPLVSASQLPFDQRDPLVRNWYQEALLWAVAAMRHAKAGPASTTSLTAQAHALCERVYAAGVPRRTCDA